MTKTGDYWEIQNPIDATHDDSDSDDEIIEIAESLHDTPVRDEVDGMPPTPVQDENDYDY